MIRQEHVFNVLNIDRASELLLARRDIELGLHLEILGDRTMVVRSPQGDLTTIVWSSTISNYGLLLLIPKSKPYELKTSLT